MPRVYTPEGEQLAWIGEAIGDDVEGLDVEAGERCGACGGRLDGGDDCREHEGPVAATDRLRYTRDGVTWELSVRRVDGE